jgi:hypothetical protein
LSQHGETAAVDHGDKLGADLHMLLLLVVREKFYGPTSDFFSRPKSLGRTA